jgi:heme oxygenase
MTILGDVTRQKHIEVEQLPLIQKLINGRLTKDEYVSYLYELYHIYDAIESLSKKHGLLDGLIGIERTHRIEKDLEELYPGYSRDVFNSTKEYIQYLNDLSNDLEKRHLLFAHVYVRHMGDLYGGKLIARIVPGEGRAYQFEDRAQLIKEFCNKLNIGLSAEANSAFDWFIRIFSEIESHNE